MLIIFVYMIMLACCYVLVISTTIETWDCFGLFRKTLSIVILASYTCLLFLIVSKLYKIFILAL